MFELLYINFCTLTYLIP